MASHKFLRRQWFRTFEFSVSDAGRTSSAAQLHKHPEEKYAQIPAAGFVAPSAPSIDYFKFTDSTYDKLKLDTSLF